MNVEYEYKISTLKFNDRETWKRGKKFLHKNNNKNFKEYMRQNYFQYVDNFMSIDVQSNLC
jgi:hypothetical protein